MSCLNCGAAWSKCLTLFKIHCLVLHRWLRWALRLQSWAHRPYVYIYFILIQKLQNCHLAVVFHTCHLPTASKYLTSYNGITSRAIHAATVDTDTLSKINLFWCEPSVCEACRWKRKHCNIIRILLFIDRRRQSKVVENLCWFGVWKSLSI